MDAIIPKAAQLASNLGLPAKLAAIIQVALQAEGVPAPVASRVTSKLADEAQNLLVAEGIIHLAAPDVEIVDERAP